MEIEIKELNVAKPINAPDDPNAGCVCLGLGGFCGGFGAFCVGAGGLCGGVGGFCLGGGAICGIIC